MTSSAQAGTVTKLRQKAVKADRSVQARAGILEAALRIFARDGYPGASMMDIAAAAGIGHPLIHYHFGSKEGLWRATIDHAFADLAESTASILRAARDLEPLDTLRLLWRATMRSVADRPERIAIVIGEARRGSELFDWVADQYLAPIYEALDSVIAAAVEKGEIKPIPAASLTSILVGSAFSFFSVAPIMERFYGVDARSPEEIERHIDQVVDAVMNGIVVTER